MTRRVSGRHCVQVFPIHEGWEVKDRCRGKIRVSASAAQSGSDQHAAREGPLHLPTSWASSACLLDPSQLVSSPRKPFRATCALQFGTIVLDIIATPVLTIVFCDPSCFHMPSSFAKDTPSFFFFIVPGILYALQWARPGRCS